MSNPLEIWANSLPKEVRDELWSKMTTPTIVMPVGMISAYGGVVPPQGWLVCDGSELSREEYKSLFNIVGTSYGVGNGSTTFNLPNLKQKFPLGKADTGTGSSLGETGGSIDHSHGGATGSHDHGGLTGAHDHGGLTGAHDHGGLTGTHDHGTTTGAPSDALTGISLLGLGESGSAGHTHIIPSDTAPISSDTASISSDTAPISSDTATISSDNPPYQVVNFIIKF